MVLVPVDDYAAVGRDVGVMTGRHDAGQGLLDDYRRELRRRRGRELRGIPGEHDEECERVHG